MLVSVALPSLPISYNSNSGASTIMDANKDVYYETSASILNRPKKLKRKASESLSFGQDSFASDVFLYDNNDGFDITVRTDVDNVKNNNSSKDLISQQSKLKIENFCANLKTNPLKLLNKDYDLNCSTELSSSLKKPKFLINDLLSGSKTAADLLASVLTSKPNGNSTSLSLSNIVADDLLSKKQKLDLKKKPSETTSNKSKHSETIMQKDITVPPNFIPNGKSLKMPNVRCRLEPDNQMLWSKFSKIGTEMIITKPGRRMFPTIKIRLENCDVSSNYYVYLDAIPVDSKRYRYVYSKSAWCCSGKADRTPPNRLYMHPDSPFSGAQLSSHIISFEKAKLTNNESDNHGHLVLNSMHKYQPRLHILRRDRNLPPLEHGGHRVNLCAPNFCDDYQTYKFVETQFMAVTAYQNQLVTEMKIAMNPFAKGFRDHGNRSGSSADFLNPSTAPKYPSIEAYKVPATSYPSNLTNSQCAISGNLLPAKPATMQQQQFQQRTGLQKNGFESTINAYAQALSIIFAAKTTTPFSASQQQQQQQQPALNASPQMLAASWSHLIMQQQQQEQQQQQQQNLLQHRKEQQVLMHQYLQNLQSAATNSSVTSLPASVLNLCNSANFINNIVQPSTATPQSSNGDSQTKQILSQIKIDSNISTDCKAINDVQAPSTSNEVKHNEETTKTMSLTSKSMTTNTEEDAIVDVLQESNDIDESSLLENKQKSLVKKKDKKRSKIKVKKHAKSVKKIKLKLHLNRKI